MWDYIVSGLIDIIAKPFRKDPREEEADVELANARDRSACPVEGRGQHRTVSLIKVQAARRSAQRVLALRPSDPDALAVLRRCDELDELSVNLARQRHEWAERESAQAAAYAARTDRPEPASLTPMGNPAERAAAHPPRSFRAGRRPGS